MKRRIKQKIFSCGNSCKLGIADSTDHRRRDRKLP